MSGGEGTAISLAGRAWPPGGYGPDPIRAKSNPKWGKSRPVPACRPVAVGNCCVYGDRPRHRGRMGQIRIIARGVWWFGSPYQSRAQHALLGRVLEGHTSCQSRLMPWFPRRSQIQA